MRRPRGPGGRFLTGDEIRALEAQQQPTSSQQSRPKSSAGPNGKTEPDTTNAPSDSAEA